MKNTTLCYVEKDGAYLMLHRIKKKNDENKDKWIGLGGKIEDGESPHECALREIKEESGLTVKNLKYRGLVTFVSDEYGTEFMHLFTADEFEGTLNDSCDEGVLRWVNKSQVTDLPIWEGDKIFLELLNNETHFFSLKLVYRGTTLISHRIDI